MVKQKAIVVPPERTWLDPSYLPGIEEARAMVLPEYTIDELVAAAKRETLIFDIEIYRNYFLAGFMGRISRKYTWIESDEWGNFDRNKLYWILNNFETMGFNSIGFDLPITMIGLHHGIDEMKDATNRIINVQEPWREVAKSYKVKVPEFNHIDLMEVAPLRSGLKGYNGRQHGPKMQDLPFHPEAELSADQKLLTRMYCLTSDCFATDLLGQNLSEQLDLRVTMGKEYGADLRSKSDAQIAEVVIVKEVEKLNGRRAFRPKIPPGTVYSYETPHFLKFQSELMQHALRTVQNAPFIVADHGSIMMPPSVDELLLEIGYSKYQMGIGGLHSTEKKAIHYSDKNFELWDFDVTSFYPRIIEVLQLFPQHLTPTFLRVYSKIIADRVRAKAAKQKVIANSLKIVVNGSYGKLGSKYSTLYAPHLLVQVTLTGQLSLLMLIERLELRGIRVVSANTDGIVIKPNMGQRDEMHAIVKQWEKDTGFTMEGAQYLGLFSRDVNNYIAIKRKKDDATGQWVYAPDGVKGKGAFANPWKHSEDKSDWLHKNPQTTICIEAIEDYLTTGTPIEDTIYRCRDVRKFVSVRKVKGGAVKVLRDKQIPPHATREELIKSAGYNEFMNGYWLKPGESDRYAINTDMAYQSAKNQLASRQLNEFYGATIRWYYAKDVNGYLVYAESGKKVPKSDGAKVLMLLPDDFPEDVDFEWYVKETKKLLKSLGVL